MNSKNFVLKKLLTYLLNSIKVNKNKKSKYDPQSSFCLIDALKCKLYNAYTHAEKDLFAFKKVKRVKISVYIFIFVVG